MDGTLAWPIVRAARTNPGGEAVVDGDVRLPWRDVHRRVAALGSGLESQGIAPGDRVAVLAHNSLPHLEAWLGLPAHGRVITDLNLRLALAEQAFMVDDSESVAIMTDDDQLERARELLDR